MRLYIAEKPSLGRAIAAVLPKPQRAHKGYIELANGDVVTWCIGHLLELAEPEDYAAQYKTWRLDHLPIVPEQWQWRAKTQTRAQLSVIKKLVKQATELVHAGDPDREGQLLVDIVLQHCKPAANKLTQAKRLLINDLNPAAVRRALSRLRSNREFIPLSTSALARVRADWLYGMNLTRSFTLRGKQQGYQGVLSVGRVQTPLLGLVVMRDKAISDFVPHAYYQVAADIHTEQGETFRAMWQPSSACEAYLDDEGRLLLRRLAEHVVNQVQGQPARIRALNEENKKQSAPLPYSLSALQIDAAKRYNMSAQQVLQAAQQLYERHALITYPRSDCRYLPSEHHGMAKGIVEAIAHIDKLAPHCTKAQLPLRSRCWNDAKVDAHHAIIPTNKTPKISALSRDELQVYQLIARQYLMQFFGAFEYAQQRIEVLIRNGLFVAKGRSIKALGWKALLDAQREQSDEQALPMNLNAQTPLTCGHAEVLDKLTQAPKAFNDASLLAAMTNIARYVSDSALKAILRENDGLGTEATRAGIIELLFKRGFLIRQGKDICASEVGKALIKALPSQCTLPDMTAQWEMQLSAMLSKAQSYQGFMQGLNEQLQQLLNQPIDASAFASLAMPTRAKPRFKSQFKRKAKAPTRARAKTAKTS